MKLLLKLLLVAVIVAAISIVTGTDWLTETVHPLLGKNLTAAFSHALPTLGNAAIGFLIVWAGSLIFQPTRCGLERCLNSKTLHLSSRGKRFWLLSYQACFWLTVGIVACLIIAPSFLDKAVLGGSIFMGVVVLAAQDAVKNMIASVCLHTMPKCHEGDYVKILTTDGAEGIIEKIDYLTCTIDEKGEGLRKVVLPNIMLWNNAVLVGKLEAKCKVDDWIKVVGVEGAEGILKSVDNQCYVIHIGGEGDCYIKVPSSTILSNAVIVGKPAEKPEKKDEEKAETKCSCCCCHCRHDDASASACCEHAGQRGVSRSRIRQRIRMSICADRGLLKPIAK